MPKYRAYCEFFIVADNENDVRDYMVDSIFGGEYDIVDNHICIDEVPENTHEIKVCAETDVNLTLKEMRDNG
jgi:hypothetical protein